MPGPQLRKLAEPTPRALVSQVNKGFGQVDYLAHYDVVQILLHHLDGPFGWSVSPPYASEDEREPVAVVGSLTVMVDGQQVQVQGVGQGTDMKNAESDAMKRAAMKIGVGLELWAQDAYWLSKQWEKEHAVSSNGQA